MNTVKINDQEYPIKFSFGALQLLAEEKKCNFNQVIDIFNIDNIMPLDIVLLAQAGINEGYRRNGEPIKLSMDQIDDILYTDINAIGRIMAIFRDSNKMPKSKNLQAPQEGANKQTSPKK